jgi:insertion element IS1 protein InsB
MIEETTKYSCRSCGSEAIIRNGHNTCGSPQYKCKACGACPVLTPKVKYTLEQKTTILRAYRERISLRGLQRVFGVWWSTVLRWLKAWVENLLSLHETLLPVQATDVLELDEYTRKSLSFSKQDAYHSLVTHWFIIRHNLTIRSSLTL